MKNRERRKLLRFLITSYKDKIPPAVGDLSKQMGVSPSTVRNYKKLLVDEGLIIDPERFNSNATLPEFLSSLDHFKKINIMAKFMDRCDLDKTDWKPHVNSLYRICCAISIHPEELINNLEQTERHYMRFEKLWKESRPNETTERYRKAVRKFCHYGPFEIPKRNKAIPGTSDSKGDYSNVFLTDEEITLGYKFFSEKGGEWETLFGVHHEIFGRPEPMSSWTNNTKVEYVDVDGETYSYGTARIYEEKQKKYYDKLIIDPRALELVSHIKQGSKIITGMSYDQWEDTYSKYLKEFYYSVGKIQPDIKYPKGVDGWLYYNRPIYTIRHSSAILWMQRTNFNTGMVAKMGWEDPKTLDKYYARSTVANIMQMGICWWHNPPKMKLGRAIFCSPMHALAYYTKELKINVAV